MRLPQRRASRFALAGALVAALIAGVVIASAPPPVQTEDPEAALAPALPTDTAVPIAQTDAAAALQAPTPEPTATATAYVGTEFERILRPFLAEASRRRQARAAADPNYWTRIDPKLNASRLNFLLFGYGETHEPPLTERAFIGSLTIFSYDYRSKSIDLISLTHDIRAPEVERYVQQTTNQTDVGPIKIDRAYSNGGFDVMGRTVEDATGLSIDFQLAFKEAAIAAATDDVFGGLDVDVPMAFDVNAYYLDGVKYPAGSFPKGLQHLNGQQVIQFIKTVPVEQNYDPALEHNARKHLVFRSIMDALRAHASDVGFISRAALFFTSQVANESIAYDFDLKPLLVDNLRSMIMNVGRSAATDQSMPGIARTMYIVDPASGDGGVQWVKANAHDNPVTARDIEENRYKELAMEVPYHGDPYAPDLVSGYWTDVRNVVRQHLTSKLS